jgi:type II secretory pathway component PulK
MDEIDHLLSSLQDHLDAAQAKALSDDIESEVDEVQSIATEIAESNIDHDEVHERVERLLELLDDIDGSEMKNAEAESHIDAARRAAERVLDR